MSRQPISWKRCSNREKIVLVVFAFVAVSALALIFLSPRSAKLNGMWKINPDAMPGYGICLEIDEHSIRASGDFVNYGGTMNFNYKIVSDHELALTYDWDFSGGWPNDIAYSEVIPLEYSLNESGKELTLSYAGTDFILLDNSSNMDIFPSPGVVMNAGQIKFYKVKE